MKIEFVNETGITYIKIPFCAEKDGEEVDGMSLPNYDYNILEAAQIPGLSQISKRIIDGKIYWKKAVDTVEPGNDFIKIRRTLK